MRTSAAPLKRRLTSLQEPVRRLESGFLIYFPISASCSGFPASYSCCFRAQSGAEGVAALPRWSYMNGEKRGVHREARSSLRVPRGREKRSEVLHHGKLEIYGWMRMCVGKNICISSALLSGSWLLSGSNIEAEQRCVDHGWTINIPFLGLQLRVLVGGRPRAGWVNLD